MNRIIKIVILLSIFSSTFTNGQDLKDLKKINSLPKKALIKELDFSGLKNIVLLDSIRYLNTPENFDAKNEFYLKDYNLKEFKYQKKTLSLLSV